MVLEKEGIDRPSIHRLILCQWWRRKLGEQITNGGKGDQLIGNGFLLANTEMASTISAASA